MDRTSSTWVADLLAQNPRPRGRWQRGRWFLAVGRRRIASRRTVNQELYFFLISQTSLAVHAALAQIDQGPAGSSSSDLNLDGAAHFGLAHEVTCG